MTRKTRVSDLLRSQRRFERWMEAHPDDAALPGNPNHCPVARYLRDEYGDEPTVTTFEVEYFDRRGVCQSLRLPRWARRFVDWFDEFFEDYWEVGDNPTNGEALDEWREEFKLRKETGQW